MARLTGGLVPALLAGSVLMAIPDPAAAIPAKEARTLSFRLQTEGMRLYKEGKFEEAAEAFRQVVNLNLNSFLAYYYLGASLVASRRYGEAIEPLKIALDLQPEYIQAHMALGDAYLKQGDSAEARAEYLRALDLQPNYAPAFDGLGRLFESIGNEKAAEEQYRKALQINVAFADAYTHLGDLYLRQERLDEAIALFLQAISVKLDFSSAYTRLGVAYARQRRFDDAIAAARRSQELAPSDPEPYVALARIYLDLESYRRAESEILSALAQDHDHPGAHLVLSDLKRAQEDFQAAREVLQGLYERGIEDAQMRRAVGAALEAVSRDAGRHAALTARAAAEPVDPVALIDLARFLSAQGTHRRAASLLERAIALRSRPAGIGPDDSIAEGGAPVGDANGQAKPGLEPAPPPLGGPVATPPSLDELRFELGLEYLAGRLYPEALAIFESIADPASPHAAPPDMRPAALFNLGVACAEIGLDHRAARAFTAYLDEHAGDPEAHLYLGNAYFRLGLRKEARASYEAYLEMAGSSTPVSRQVLDILRALDASAPAGPATVEAGPPAGAVKDRS